MFGRLEHKPPFATGGRGDKGWLLQWTEEGEREI